MGKLAAEPQLLAFIICQQAERLPDPFVYSVARAFVLYPVSRIPCRVLGFQWLVEFTGGKGVGSVSLSLRQPSDDALIWTYEKSVEFRGPWMVKSLSGKTGEFEIAEAGRYRMDLSLNGAVIAVRPVTVVTPGTTT